MHVFKLLYNFIFHTKRRGLTAKAVFYSAVARFRIRFFPGGRLHRYFGEKGGETGTEVPGEKQRRDIYFVSRRVERVAQRVPWESKCLVQAMVAQRLLRDYGVDSTLYLGVSRDKEGGGKMIAHAWVRSGPYSVCGGDGTGYVAVAKFAMGPR
jgi:hypothetical protein